MPEESTDLANDPQKLAEAQRNRPAEEVGPVLGHGAIRRVTADYADPHRDWTVQSGRTFPNEEQRVVTRFNRSELPDPQKAVDAGHLPMYLPGHLIDDEHVTQGPAGEVAQDDPVRAKEEYLDDPGYRLSKDTDVAASLEISAAQVEGRDPDLEKLPAGLRGVHEDDDKAERKDEGVEPVVGDDANSEV